MALQGSKHQGNNRNLIVPGLGQGGTQCTIMALAALIMCSQIMQPSSWSREVIDLVLMEGDYFYSYVIDSLYGGNHSTHIGHDQIPTSVDIYGNSFQVNVLQTLFGITTMCGDAEFESVSITDALQLSLAISSVVLVTIGAESFSIFQDQSGVYMFDSHARDIHGNIDGDGAAILMHFSGQGEAVNFMMSRYGNMAFEFSSLHITKAQAASHANATVTKTKEQVSEQSAVEKQSFVITTESVALNRTVYNMSCINDVGSFSGEGASNVNTHADENLLPGNFDDGIQCVPTMNTIKCHNVTDNHTYCNNEVENIRNNGTPVTATTNLENNSSYHVNIDHSYAAFF